MGIVILSGVPQPIGFSNNAAMFIPLLLIQQTIRPTNEHQFVSIAVILPRSGASKCIGLFT